MKFKPVKTAVIGSGMISDIYLTNLKNTFSIVETKNLVSTPFSGKSVGIIKK